MNDSLNGISIIVCCYNSAKRLPQTIKHIASQKNISSIKWELIVVDNNSSDETINIAREEWEKYALDIPFQLVSEEKQGLSYARIKGLKSTNYDLLIFCDDDNWLQEDYLFVAYSVMNSNKNIGLAGGRSTGEFEVAQPFWFEHFESAYAVGKQMDHTGYANNRRYLVGAGIIIRANLFKKIDELSFQFLLSGRRGKEVTSGEDSELCLVAMNLGYDLYYDERLQFTHYITTNRLQWKYCVEMITRGFAYPQIYFAMYDYCFNAINNNQSFSFEDLIRWNIRKQKRILLNECKGISNLFSTGAALLYSKAGNDKEIIVKTAINKILYIRRQKKQLAEDFEKILALAKRMKPLRLTAIQHRTPQ